MAFRDTQIVISRQSVLLVTGVGVGLLTLSYVLGVQVGKQSSALRRPSVKSAEEELRALPEPLVDQLATFETVEPPSEPRPKIEAPKTEAPKPEAPKEEKKAESSKSAKDDGSRWNLQLVATSDPKEAERVAAKAKAAGYATTTLHDKKLYKVRVAKAQSRSEADAASEKLKEKGLKPFATRAE